MFNHSIKILDCTLRDGGYLNDWSFNKDNIESILNNLFESHIDFIECGFLKETKYDINKTFFPSIEFFENLIKPNQK